METKEKNLYNVYKENTNILKSFIEKGEDFKIKKDIFEPDFTRHFEEYVKFGGYPEVIKTDDIETKRIVLKNIYNTYITKDIIELLRLEDTTNFRTIIILLANNIGGLVNYNSLAVDGKSYFRQVKHYLNYIINNFNELSLRQDRGKLVENTVLSSLYYKESDILIKHWRTTGKAEVDFILDNRRTIVPIEVKYSHLKSIEVSRGFRNFINQYRLKHGVVLTKGFWAKTIINGTKVGFVPVWYA